MGVTNSCTEGQGDAAAQWCLRDATVTEIADYIATLGPKYAQPSQAFRDYAVDGEVLTDLQNDAELMDFLRSMGLGECPVECAVLKKHFRRHCSGFVGSRLWGSVVSPSIESFEDTQASSLQASSDVHEVRLPSLEHSNNSHNTTDNQEEKDTSDGCLAVSYHPADTSSESDCESAKSADSADDDVDLAWQSTAIAGSSSSDGSIDVNTQQQHNESLSMSQRTSSGDTTANNESTSAGGKRGIRKRKNTDVGDIDVDIVSGQGGLSKEHAPKPRKPKKPIVSEVPIAVPLPLLPMLPIPTGYGDSSRLDSGALLSLPDLSLCWKVEPIQDKAAASPSPCPSVQEEEEIHQSYGGERPEWSIADIESIMAEVSNPVGKFLSQLNLSPQEILRKRLMDVLEKAPQIQREKYGARKQITDEERMALNRERNRQHASCTRLRKKIFNQALQLANSDS